MHHAHDIDTYENREIERHDLRSGVAPVHVTAADYTGGTFQHTEARISAWQGGARTLRCYIHRDETVSPTIALCFMTETSDGVFVNATVTLPADAEALLREALADG